jgi:hypothetical protein
MSGKLNKPTRPSADAIALAKKILDAANESAEPANDDVIDEEAIRELARRDAEQMKRARNR